MKKITLTIFIVGGTLLFHSCKAPVPYQEPSKCDKSNYINIDIATTGYRVENLDANDPVNNPEIVGEIVFDTINQLTGRYTSTVSILGSSGTYKRNCTLNSITFTPIGDGEILCDATVNNIQNNQSGKMTDVFSVNIPGKNAFGGEYQYIFKKQ